jgi:hypothetical protein
VVTGGEVAPLSQDWSGWAYYTESHRTISPVVPRFLDSCKSKVSVGNHFSTQLRTHLCYQLEIFIINLSVHNIERDFSFF